MCISGFHVCILFLPLFSQSKHYMQHTILLLLQIYKRLTRGTRMVADSLSLSSHYWFAWLNIYYCRFMCYTHEFQAWIFHAIKLWKTKIDNVHIYSTDLHCNIVSNNHYNVACCCSFHAYLGIRHKFTF